MAATTPGLTCTEQRRRGGRRGQRRRRRVTDQKGRRASHAMTPGPPVLPATSHFPAQNLRRFPSASGPQERGGGGGARLRSQLVPPAPQQGPRADELSGPTGPSLSGQLAHFMTNRAAQCTEMLSGPSISRTTERGQSCLQMIDRGGYLWCYPQLLVIPPRTPPVNSALPTTGVYVTQP